MMYNYGKKIAAARQAIEKRIGTPGLFGSEMLISLLLAMGFLVAFAKLAEDVLYKEVELFDSIVVHIIRSFTSPGLTKVMTLLSFLGSFTFYVPLCILLMLFLYLKKKHFWDALLVPLVLLGSYLLNTILKVSFHRPRPGILPLVEAGGYSFPSGHSMVGFAFYGMTAYLIWLNTKKSWLRLIAGSFFIALAVFIGISRIYLGVHYPSDVLAGFAVGCFWLVGSIVGLSVIRYYKGSNHL